MPFGLKNARETYQQLVNKVFKHLIRKNTKVYADNMIVKSREVIEHTASLQETFVILHGYGILAQEMCF